MSKHKLKKVSLQTISKRIKLKQNKIIVQHNINQYQKLLVIKIVIQIFKNQVSYPSHLQIAEIY